eukprot:CAMPEP_0173466084 /NCGR_PEP_ID=MMETSP1357-20121228/72718_1 /TAXON_ID=77926 /ORGANISM="Hemiselmis rufescens, Strain PCC563" /LENGTH=88 /DNA_ID=CAMNT_0014434107 /DNA_START=52 /DNA_END=314 /DNA_ORIENTATION=-
MDWLTKPFESFTEPIFSCMEPKRHDDKGEKGDKGRVTLLCAAMDCSGTSRSGPASNKKAVSSRRGMPGQEPNNDHTKHIHGDPNGSRG